MPTKAKQARPKLCYFIQNKSFITPITTGCNEKYKQYTEMDNI